MINLVTLDKAGHKVARPVTTREEYQRIRNSEENKRNFSAARAGDERWYPAGEPPPVAQTGLFRRGPGYDGRETGTQPYLLAQG